MPEETEENQVEEPQVVSEETVEPETEGKAAKKKASKAGRPAKVRQMERDENGLVVGVKYVYTEEGFVDWRKMIPLKYLAVNKERVLKTEDTDVSIMSEEELDEFKQNTDDKNLYVLLAGYKFLAKLRGYTSVTYKVSQTHSGNPVIKCRINWTANFETNGEPVVFESVASATADNTDGIFSGFLESIAENRSFIRTVRNFLGIDILGESEGFTENVAHDEDEEGEPEVKKESINMGPEGALKAKLDKMNIDFDKLKKNLIRKEFAGAAELTCFEDITKSQALLILEMLNKKTS
jgi:hypothetical protein